jgi:hypothetical protein
MSKFRFTKRRGLVALGLIVSLALAGSAYAYWSGSGSGSGGANVANGHGVTLSATVADGIAPGLSSSVSVTAANAGASAVQVGTVSLVSVTADGTHAQCNVSDFSMAPVIENHSVPAAATAEALPVHGSLVYANTGVSQDGCKGATLTLSLSSN